MGLFSSRTAAQYDVGFNVLLGPFRAQLGEAVGLYGRTTGQMSTESLKLAVRQTDLAKAIERYGAESTQAARKTILLRDEMVSLGAASERTNTHLLSQERTLGRFARGSFVGSGVGRSGLLFGSGAFVGGLALVSGLKSALDAAKENQVAQGQLQVALQDSGLAWGRNKDRIDENLQSLIKTTAFTNTDLTAALANNVRRFGDIDTALHATAIEADVARAKNMSLADAQTIVQRASAGQSRSLLSLGITFVKSTASVDALKASTKYATAEQKANAKAADLQANRVAALDLIEQKFHGNAARYLQTSAGKQALFNAELKRSEEIIGQALLPEFNRLLTRLSAYLDRMNRTGKLQKDVNTVVRDAGSAFHVIGSAIHGVSTLISPLNRLLGGSATTVRDITAALIAFKLRGVAAFVTGAAEIEAASVPLIAAESAAAAGAVLPAAGVVGRVAAYTGAGTVAAGGAAAAGSKGLLAKGLGLAASAFVLGDIGDETGGVQKLGGPLDVTVSTFPGGSGAFVKYRDPVTGASRILTLQKGVNIGAAIKADIASRHPGFSLTPSGSATNTTPGISRGTAATGAGNSGPPPPRPRGGLVLGLTQAQQTPLLQAEGTKGTADDVSALNKQLGILNRLVAQKGLNAAQLNSLLEQRNSVLAQLDSITTKLGSVNSKAQTAADRLYRHQESILKTALAEAKNSGKETQIAKAAAALSAFYRRESGDAKLSQAIRDSARARLVGLKKSANGIAGVIRHQESLLKLAVDKATLTPTTSDDIKALKKLEAFYRKEADDPRLKQAMRDTFAARAVAEKKKLQKLGLAQKSAFQALERQFLSTFASIVGTDSSNIGANAVTSLGKGGNTVNVHFHQIPATIDRHREARLTRLAMQSAFDA